MHIIFIQNHLNSWMNWDLSVKLNYEDIQLGCKGFKFNKIIVASG